MDKPKPRATIFVDDEQARWSLDMLAKHAQIHHNSRHATPWRLRSLVAISGRSGARLFTPPVITDAGVNYLTNAARDAGWQPCYVVAVRPKR